MGLCNRIEEDSESGAISTDATSDVIGQGLMIQYLNWSVFPPPLIYLLILDMHIVHPSSVEHVRKQVRAVPERGLLQLPRENKSI